jgi:hypothetical protein
MIYFSNFDITGSRFFPMFSSLLKLNYRVDGSWSPTTMEQAARQYGNVHWLFLTW